MALGIAILIPGGWYLARLTSSSTYEDQPWLSESGGDIPIRYKAIDGQTIVLLRPMFNQSVHEVEAFFGQRFPAQLTFYILPDRAALDDHWRTSFGSRWFVSTCWMVGSGSARQLSILSPREWQREDCGHDPSDADEIHRLIVHELTHSFHDQVNPSEDIGVYEDIGWFIEGVAVLVSGQLDSGQLASPREAIESGEAPSQLEDAWSGQYRYGVSGSMVEYLESTQGRNILLELMGATSEAEILSRLGVTEQEFITGWRRYVMSRTPRSLEEKPAG